MIAKWKVNSDKGGFVRQVLPLCFLAAISSCSRADRNGSQVRAELKPNTIYGKDELKRLAEKTEVCRMVIGHNPHQVFEYRLSDRHLIKTLVIDSLGSAKVDDDPAYYELYGEMTLEGGGEILEEIELLLPFGIIGTRDALLIADFRGLKDHLLPHLTRLGCMRPQTPE